MENKKEFMQFLIDNDVYKQFKLYIETYRGDSLEEYLDICSPISYMIGAFPFRENKEGPAFWHSINEKWMEHIGE